MASAVAPAIADPHDDVVAQAIQERGDAEDHQGPDHYRRNRYAAKDIRDQPEQCTQYLARTRAGMRAVFCHTTVPWPCAVTD